MRVVRDQVFIELVVFVMLLKTALRHVLEEHIEEVAILMSAQVLDNVFMLQAVQ